MASLILFFIGMALCNLFSGLQAVPVSQNKDDVASKNETNKNIIQFYDERFDLSELKLAGDIMFSEAQLNDEVNDDDKKKDRNRRRRDTVGPVRPVATWKDGVVPYVFNFGMTDEQKKKIKWAMKIIERRSCIKFQETSFTDRPKHFLAITTGNGCYSTVGSSNFPLNILSLKFPNCFDCSSIVHELLHALGFFHEQQRMVRDKYVKINWKNIQPGQQYNFKKVKSLVDTDQTYDMRSLMHYKSYDFSSNGEPTIECINADGTACQLGGKWLRYSDTKKLNKVYGCKPKRFGYSSRYNNQ
ncbi:seminal metalloprotease 1-like [Clytia hemisphaerica]|uniref:Metalloendopeptidase n=1 Tax=Clytia hemisphaerica TaxID=252671 RepID=A0A7M6DPJ3_9CNID|eukprot:TCONS_00071313-protein